MAIDDPVQAVQRRFEDEERASDPVFSRLTRLASDLHLPWPADKVVGAAVGRLAANRIERIELLIAAILDELHRHERKLEELSKGSEDETQRRFQEWFSLVEDGLKKAEGTRAKERVQRIGIILARSLVRTPGPSADDVEEMMRIATELSDVEVRSLSNLVGLQGKTVEAAGRISRYDAWNSWPTGVWGQQPDSETDSIFRKLESFGLVSQVPAQSNVNITADIQNRYALLKKGLDFIRFAGGRPSVR